MVFFKMIKKIIRIHTKKSLGVNNNNKMPKYFLFPSSPTRHHPSSHRLFTNKTRDITTAAQTRRQPSFSPILARSLALPNRLYHHPPASAAT
jgi:hypothetical protein